METTTKQIDLDKRLKKKGLSIVKGIEEIFISSVHTTFKKRKDCVAAYRYLKNGKVTESYLIENLTMSCKQRIKGKKVLVLCDTTDYNLNNHRNRIKDMRGLGWSGDNTTRGFMHQGLLIHDREEKAKCYGWAGSYFYYRDSPEKHVRSYRSNISIEGKESFKWLGPSLQCRDRVLEQAEHALFVMDREADIFEVMTLLPKAGTTDVLIRIQQNRRVKNLMINQLSCTRT